MKPQVLDAGSPLAHQADITRRGFEKTFGPEGEIVEVAAPGRVNLIGEHTDYNDGFVLPAAIDRWVVFVGRRRSDRTVRLFSLDFDNTTVFDLDDIGRDANSPWSHYVRGVALLLTESHRLPAGFDAAVHGNIPQGAGLSSSAAMEVGAARLMQSLYPFEMSGPDIARLGQRAENEFVGVNCGIMDQFASTMGRAGQAIMLDCRDLSYRHVDVPFDRARIVICNSGVKRQLVDSAYNERRSQCEEAVAELQTTHPDITALRDVTEPILEEEGHRLRPVVKKRAQHVVSEDKRVVQAVDALARGDIATFGQLMNASHTSLQTQYEVSCPELDALVNIAQRIPGTLGARMTGAGFGGCTVNLVLTGDVDQFVDTVRRDYKAAVGIDPKVYVCRASAGAGRIKLEA